MRRLVKIRFFTACIILGLFFSYYLVSLDVEAAGADEIVMFNTKSYKYHCPSCRWQRNAHEAASALKRAKRSNAAGYPVKSAVGHVSRMAKLSP